MLFFGVLSLLLATASAHSCYGEIEKACKVVPSESKAAESDCTAKFAAIGHHLTNLQSLANANIDTSFKFLLMSTHFGNFEQQREGFKKLYRKYSDELWEDAINVIKYIAKRGGEMNFNMSPRFQDSETQVLQLYELSSLAKALDIQKQLEKEAREIHYEAQLHEKHDPSISHYIEEKFLGQHTERIRDLSGYANDLKSLLSQHDGSLSLFLFDEYLQKSL